MATEGEAPNHIVRDRFHGSSDGNSAAYGQTFQMDVFLSLVRPLALGPMPASEAQTHEGPHVYVLVASSSVDYPLGTSRVAYIGYSDGLRRRFAKHEKLRTGDEVWIIPLQSTLRQVKQHHASWRQMNKRQGRILREELERILYYWFERLFGAKPVRNGKMLQPTREGMLVAQFALELQIGHAGTPEEVANFGGDGHLLAKEIERRLPGSLTRRTSSRGTIVLGNHRTDLVLIRSFTSHCRVRVRCAGLGFCHVADHANLRDARNWLAPVHVDSEYALSGVVSTFHHDWLP